MWQAVGHLLPIAIAVAFSSVPIMAMILILQSPKRTRSALPFLIGWTIGIALVILLSTLSAEALPERFLRQPDTIPVVLEIVAGSALVGLGIFAARRRSTPEAVGLPRWLRALDSSGPVTSFAGALVLNFRPKGLLLGVAAGLSLYAASLRTAGAAVAIAIYTVLSASTVAIPILATLIRPQRMEPKLRVARDWLSKNGNLITAVMLFMIGVVIVGDSLTKL